MSRDQHLQPATGIPPLTVMMGKMLFGTCIVALIGVSAARSIKPPILAQEPFQHHEAWHFPSVHESAVLARRILHLTTIGDLVSRFPEAPSTHHIVDTSTSPQELVAFENRPTSVAGSPIGLVEYYADCEPTTGNPTLLAINIATPYKNAAAGSNISLTVRWWPDQKDTYLPRSHSDDDDLPTPHTPMALPRMSLHGYLEPIPGAELAEKLIPACFTHTHPDAALWQPGNEVHASTYVRLVVEHVYWLGGFGDRARIQWLPVEEWRNVTMEEVGEARLPGERKKSEGCGGLETGMEGMPYVPEGRGRQGSLERAWRDWWEGTVEDEPAAHKDKGGEGRSQRRLWETVKDLLRGPRIHLGADW